jgi:hypothetical protein
MMTLSKDVRNELEEARKAAIARAEQEAAEAPAAELEDLDEAECFVRLVIAMYASKLKVGMGVMPDGMAIYLRLSIPKGSTDPRAGMVSFVVSSDTQAVLLKAVGALDASAQSSYWKPDRFADQQGS